MASTSNRRKKTDETDQAETPTAVVASTTEVVVMKQDCGPILKGTAIGTITTPKGVSVNFLVDALRSGIASAVAQELHDEQQAAAAEDEADQA